MTGISIMYSALSVSKSLLSIKGQIILMTFLGWQFLDIADTKMRRYSTVPALYILILIFI